MSDSLCDCKFTKLLEKRQLEFEYFRGAEIDGPGIQDLGVHPENCSIKIDTKMVKG